MSRLASASKQITHQEKSGDNRSRQLIDLTRQNSAYRAPAANEIQLTNLSQERERSCASDELDTVGEARSGFPKLLKLKASENAHRHTDSYPVLRLVTALLYGLTPTNSLPISFAVLAMIAVAALAGHLPAREASQVDLLVALRCE